MSIRGIDTQMMIARSSDMVRETGPLMKSSENFQAQLANMAKQEAGRNIERVIATTETEMDNVRTDKDGSGSGAAGGEGSSHHGSSSGEDGSSQDLDLLVGTSKHKSLIDITV